jgi:ribosomal-protein-alanine N-acetyltransferase
MREAAVAPRSAAAQTTSSSEELARIGDMITCRMRIELERCVLRSWRDDDAEALAAGANNRNVWMTLRDLMPHPYSLADAEAFLRRVSEKGPKHSFCIEVDGKAAGAISLRFESDVHRLTAELGYWLAEPFWGGGVMSEAVRGLVDYAFRTYSLRRIFASVYANNPASARVLEKAGFAFEGRMRQNVIKEGQILDSLLYARLREDEAGPERG